MVTNEHYFRIADITLQVKSDLPIASDTFNEKFDVFRVFEPGEDTAHIFWMSFFEVINARRMSFSSRSSGSAISRQSFQNDAQ